MELAFSHVDLTNLPADFMPFERSERRGLEVYEVYEGVSYVIDGSVVREVHNFRPMTLQEKDTYIQTITQEWQVDEFYKPSWVYSDTEGYFTAPVPRPTDGKIYKWDEATISWVVQTGT
jgi:hypothetical protein